MLSKIHIMLFRLPFLNLGFLIQVEKHVLENVRFSMFYAYLSIEQGKSTRSLPFSF